MSLLAATRPDDVNLALFVHLLGALVLVGALVLALSAVASRNMRLGYRALLLVAIPSWIVMRVGAQWIAAKEGFDDPDDAPAWIDIGFMTSEPTFVMIVIAAICSGVAARRERAGGLRTAALVLVGISLAAYVVAIWAMSIKPS